MLKTLEAPLLNLFILEDIERCESSRTMGQRLVSPWSGHRFALMGMGKKSHCWKDKASYTLAYIYRSHGKMQNAPKSQRKTSFRRGRLKLTETRKLLNSAKAYVYIDISCTCLTAAPLSSTAIQSTEFRPHFSARKYTDISCTCLPAAALSSTVIQST